MNFITGYSTKDTIAEAVKDIKNESGHLPKK